MRWTFVAATQRGTSHIKACTRVQDAKSCFEHTNDDGEASLFAVVSDGAGSASFGGQGASLVCRTMARKVSALFREPQCSLADADIWAWTDEVKDLLAECSKRRAVTRREFAATMILLIATPREVLTAHIGDGAVAARRSGAVDWQIISASENGEYASTTYFITDDATVRLRIARHPPDYDAFAVFSDGIESIAVDAGSGEASSKFFGSLIRPLDSTSATGRQSAMSGQLRAFLDSPGVNERTDDDKTLILAVRK